MLLHRAALWRHDYTATRAERLQNARHWVLRLDADGPREPLRQRPEFVNAVKQRLKLQDAHLAETKQSLIPIRLQQRQRQNQQFEGGENFDYNVDRKTGWQYYREPRGSPQTASSFSTSQWPTSQWQTSWSARQPTSSEKWWWFRFPGKNSRKSTRCADRTPTDDTHLCSTVCSQARNAHHAMVSRESPSTICISSLCAWKESSHLVWYMSHLWLSHHLPQSLFLLPRHQNTQHNRYNKSNSENTQYITHISKVTVDKRAPSRTTSDVKTCRVAETRARQLPQFSLSLTYRGYTSWTSQRESSISVQGNLLR